MTAPDNGPYDSERQARAAALAAIPPEDGWSILRTPQCRQLLEQACAEAGVELGDYDRRILDWLAGFEDSACMVVAGLIARAAQRPEAATEWGVSFGDAAGIPRGPVVRYYDEDEARQAKRDVEALSQSRRGTVVSRQTWAGPWTPAPEEGEGNG